MKNSEKNVKVVLIEDSIVNTLLVNVLFDENPEIKVFNISTTKNVMSELLQINPHVILLDIMMPVTDGFTVLKNIKQHLDLKDIPVIILSAKDTPDALELAKNLGAIDYIIKPLGNSNFYSRVMEVIHQFTE